jgi:uncharacterized protein (TIGR02246 family)
VDGWLVSRWIGHSEEVPVRETRAFPTALLAVAMSLSAMLVTRPVWGTPDVERAIRAEVADFGEARTAGDVDRVLSHIADDAKFVSFAGRNVTKAEYRALVRKAVENPDFRGMTVTYRVLQMRILGETRAVVDVEQVARSPDSFSKYGIDERNYLRWTFEKRGDRWLIVEQIWAKP